MMMKNKKPDIRFKGFSEEWEEKELDNIADVRDGTHDSPQYFPSGRPFVTSKNVKDGYINFDDVQYISEVDFVEINKRSKVDINDILMGMIGTIGNIALVREEPNFAIKNVALIKDTTKVYYLYLYHYLQSPIVLRQLEEGVDGGTQKFIALNKVRNLAISTPTLSEQTQIGNFFKNLDNLISLHQRKYEKLEILKKAMLEKMFPKNGADVPEIRFKGFSGAWEERTLGEICVIGDIDHRMPESVTDGIPYIMTGSFTGINDIDFEDSKLISTEDYEQLAKKIKPEMGDILFARYASVGAVRYVETQMKFLVSYSCAILKNNSTFNSKYLFYYLQSKETQRQIELEINTGSQRNIGIDSLKKLNIFIPQDTEQEKIGNYFKNLDKLLTLHHGELDKLKNLKKALLEKMFV